MTLSISQLRDRVATHFPGAEQVSDSVIRFMKKIGDQPYAVYYLDITQDLPSSKEALTKYQDHIIGKCYFEGKKSLQWSNYLYFITSHDNLKNIEAVKAKDLIERDRNYARKFVIPEEELERILNPPVISSADVTPHAGVLSIWTEKLVEAGLDKSIFSDDDLPRRLSLIENPASKATSKIRVSKRATDVDDQPNLHSLKLNEFRDFPCQREFEFGKVNLIFGRNGSGKTSLLEAIEFFYCGTNKRNAKAQSRYLMNVEFANGKSEAVTTRRKPQVFRDRNLMWYGQPEVRTNYLYQSFSQFNFLNTDAAVDLADSTSRIEDDLSKLLVGPEASIVWRNIERVNTEVSKKKRDLDRLKVQINSELFSLKKILAESSNVRRESDSVSIRLNEMIDRIGWSRTLKDKEEFAASLVESLSELLSIVHQAIKIELIVSPVSVENMAIYCQKTKLIIEKAKADLAQLESLRKEKRKTDDAISRDRRALEMIKKLRRFVDAKLLELVEDISNQQSKVATLSDWLAGLELDKLNVIVVDNRNNSMADFKQSLMLKRSNAENLLADTEKEYKKFSELRKRSLNLAQQLREIAGKILQDNPKPDECPLCHTQFSSGVLVKHINIGVDEGLEGLGQTLLARLREKEEALDNILSIDKVFGLLIKFCDKANLTIDMPVDSVLNSIKDTIRKLTETKVYLNTLKNELQTLEAQGISTDNLELITDQLYELGYSLNTHSENDLNDLLLKVDQREKDSSKALEGYLKEIGALRDVLINSLESTEPDGYDLDARLSQMKEKLTETEIIQEKLGYFSSLFPWPKGKPLAELVVESESIRKVAAELQAALANEKQAKTSYAVSIKRKELIQEQLDKLLPRIERLKSAHSAFSEIQKNHSLNSAMEIALQENREAIESVFSQIHSPAEFRGLGSSWTTLIRKVDGSAAKLTEISTGQRSAFALSIFLAQNAKLRAAPPIILIDDPIAHVDDMNSLSFLDYLRDVALKGQRQIFFATASDKLASLFERKFDFLGDEEYRRFNLIRND